MTMSVEIIISGLAASAGAFALWVIKRWIAGLEAKLSQISGELRDLSTHSIVSQERHNSLVGGIEMLRVSTKETSDSVAVLCQSVSTLWTTLKAKKILEERPSDLAKS